MEPKVQEGYLVLADISGYTSYLAETELEHSHEILNALLKTIIGSLSSKLVIAEVEGDAIFAYAPASVVTRGETLLELIEMSYVAFRDRQDGMRRLTTCVCRACQQLGTLDLKFVTHFGSFILQSIEGKSKPLGSDVNLVHRLLKNGVESDTGWKGYSLMSGQCLSQLGMPCDGMHLSTQEYEHLGSIETHSVNLAERYTSIKEQQRVAIASDEADTHLTYEFPFDRDVVWDWLVDPERRGDWVEGTRWSAAQRLNGRTGPGSINHCAHGKDSVAAEEILDWRPLEYYTTRMALGPFTIVTTMKLANAESGTHLDATYRLEGRMPRWLLRPGCRVVTKFAKFEESWRNLDALIAKTLQ